MGVPESELNDFFVCLFFCCFINGNRKVDTFCSHIGGNLKNLPILASKWDLKV